MTTKFDRLKEVAQEVLDCRGPGKDWHKSINASVAFQNVAQPQLILELIEALEKSTQCAVCITEPMARDDKPPVQTAPVGHLSLQKYRMTQFCQICGFKFGDHLGHTDNCPKRLKHGPSSKLYHRINKFKPEDKK